MKAQIDDLTQRIKALEAGGKPSPPSEPDFEEPEQPEPEDDEIVYITKGGKKYHRKGCRHLKKSVYQSRKGTR